MNVIIVVCLALVVISMVLITFTVTKKNVRRHSIEFVCGKIFRFKTETEFI